METVLDENGLPVVVTEPPADTSLWTSNSNLTIAVHNTAGAVTLNGPKDVHYDAPFLYVADTGNGKVHV